MLLGKLKADQVLPDSPVCSFYPFWACVRALDARYGIELQRLFYLFFGGRLTWPEFMEPTSREQM